jgi:hypothetical protein
MVPDPTFPFCWSPWTLTLNLVYGFVSIMVTLITSLTEHIDILPALGPFNPSRKKNNNLLKSVRSLAISMKHIFFYSTDRFECETQSTILISHITWTLYHTEDDYVSFWLRNINLGKVLVRKFKTKMDMGRGKAGLYNR